LKQRLSASRSLKGASVVLETCSAMQDCRVPANLIAEKRFGDKSMITDQDTAARLRLAGAIQRVCRKRHDFEAVIYSGFREMMTQMSGVDPHVSHYNFQIGLDSSDESLKEAQLQLIRAVLYVWYKVTPELQSMVFTSVREFAFARNADRTMAMMEAGLILDDARGAASAMEDQRAKVDKKQAERERARQKRADAHLRRRLSVEGL
jgi:hypothetical protein